MDWGAQMVKLATVAAASLVVGALILFRANSPVIEGAPIAPIAGRNANRLDVGERIPNCWHTAWRNYDSACGYGVQWPVGAARKISELAGDRPLVGNAE
jgi:hypothetical protein